jgi:hypothetical protein
MAPSLTGRGWGWVGFSAAEAVSRFPGPPLEDPPTSPPRNSTGAPWGERGGTTGARAAPPHGRRSVAADVPARLAQRLQRRRPDDPSSGGSAADVPPSAATLARRSSRCEQFDAAGTQRPGSGHGKGPPRASAGSAGLTVLGQGWKPVRGETPVPRWLDAQRDSPAPRSGETPRRTGTWQNLQHRTHHPDTQRQLHRQLKPGQQWTPPQHQNRG